MGTSLMVQWLTLCPSNAWGTGFIPGWETKIPHDAQPTQLSPHEEKNFSCDALIHCFSVAW